MLLLELASVFSILSLTLLQTVMVEAASFKMDIGNRKTIYQGERLDIPISPPSIDVITSEQYKLYKIVLLINGKYYYVAGASLMPNDQGLIVAHMKMPQMKLDLTTKVKICIKNSRPEPGWFSNQVKVCSRELRIIPPPRNPAIDPELMQKPSDGVVEMQTLRDPYFPVVPKFMRSEQLYSLSCSYAAQNAFAPSQLSLILKGDKKQYDIVPKHQSISTNSPQSLKDLNVKFRTPQLHGKAIWYQLCIKVNDNVKNSGSQIRSCSVKIPVHELGDNGAYDLPQDYIDSDFADGSSSEDDIPSRDLAESSASRRSNAMPIAALSVGGAASGVGFAAVASARMSSSSENEPALQPIFEEPKDLRRSTTKIGSNQPAADLMTFSEDEPILENIERSEDINFEDPAEIEVDGKTGKAWDEIMARVPEEDETSDSTSDEDEIFEEPTTSTSNVPRHKLGYGRDQIPGPSPFASSQIPSDVYSPFGNNAANLRPLESPNNAGPLANSNPLFMEEIQANEYRPIQPSLHNDINLAVYDTQANDVEDQQPTVPSVPVPARRARLRQMYRNVMNSRQ